MYQVYFEVNSLVLPRFLLQCLLHVKKSRTFADAGGFHVILFSSEDWEEPSTDGKISSLEDPPCSKDNKKVRSPRVSGTSRQLFPGLHALYVAQIRSTNSFASKSCLTGRTTDTCVQRQHCVLSVTQRREAGRNALLQDFWKALPLFRVQVGWGAKQMAAVRHGLSTDGEFIPSEISGGLDDSPIWLQTPKACITPTHPVIMTFSSLQKARRFRDTDTYMGKEKPDKMADGKQVCIPLRGSQRGRRGWRSYCSLASFVNIPVSPWMPAGWDTLVFKM